MRISFIHPRCIILAILFALIFGALPASAQTCTKSQIAAMDKCRALPINSKSMSSCLNNAISIGATACKPATVSNSASPSSQGCPQSQASVANDPSQTCSQIQLAASAKCRALPPESTAYKCCWQNAILVGVQCTRANANDNHATISEMNKSIGQQMHWAPAQSSTLQ